MSHDPPRPRPARTRLQRWLLATLGVVSVGVGAVGVLLPGLPTTIFLLAASWCFARSCPWLEERLIRVPLFRPFLGSLEPGARMPLRAVLTTLAVMWLAVSASAALVGLGEPSRPTLAAVIVALGLVGTLFVLRLRERPAGGAAEPLQRRAAESPSAAD
jgi:uncharacterized protein